MSIFYMFFLRHIVHSANGTLTCCIATAAIAMHGANIGGSVGLAFAMSRIIGAVTCISAGRNDCAAAHHGQQKEKDFNIFHHCEFLINKKMRTKFDLLFNIFSMKIKPLQR